MNVFITGASGLVGSRLVTALKARGDSVVPLSRKTTTGGLVGDPATPGPWQDALADCDAVVHLAGENIFAKRWTAAFMQEIRDSRVNSTRLIAETLAKNPGRTKVFVSASAVGYYGDCVDAVQTEESPPGNGFMADVCREWETAADPARTAVRVVHPRLGIVLDPNGGAMPKLLGPYKLFAGGRIGTGRQFVSWIHHTDLTRILLFALDMTTLAGPCNATSPNPVTNDTLGRTIGKVIHRPHWLPAPSFAVRLALGKVADSILRGQRVIPTRLTAAGFAFDFADPEVALRDVTGR